MVVILLLLLLIAMQFGKTQKLLADKVFDYLNNKYNVAFVVDDIKISPFGEFNIQNLLVKDHHQDTLVYAKNVQGVVYDLHEIKNKVISIKDVELSNVWVNDKTYVNEKISSLMVFSNQFTPKKKSKKALQILLKNIQSHQVRYAKLKDTTPLVDFSEIGGNIKQVNIKGINVFAETDSLSFKDIYQINYQKIQTKFRYSLSEMHFEDTHIVTDSSSLYLDAKFLSSDIGYANFVNTVKVEGEIHKSNLAISDVHKIYPHFVKNTNFHISSIVKGTLNDLKLDKTIIESEDETAMLKGDFLLKNSIENRESFWFSGTHTTLKAIPNTLFDVVPEQYQASLPTEYYGLENFNYKGDVYVSKTTLVTNGYVTSNLGSLNVNGVVDGLTSETRKFDVKFKNGLVLPNQQFKHLKSMAFEGTTSGVLHKNTKNIESAIAVEQLSYKNNTFSDLNLNLTIDDKDIDAKLTSRDSLLSFTSDLQLKNTPLEGKKYKVGFKIDKAKLSKLFPANISFQKNITANGALNIEEHVGNVKAIGSVNNLHIETVSDSLDLNHVDLTFASKGIQKTINLFSKDLIKLNVEGDFEFEDFEKLVENALYKFIPGQKTRSDVKGQTINFAMELHPSFVKSFTNKAQFSKVIDVSGVLDTQGDKGVIYANTPSVVANDIRVDSLKIVLDNSNKWINSNVSAKEFTYKKQVYQEVSLLGKKLNDTLFVRSNFNSDKLNNRAIFYLTTQDEFINIGIENVYFKYLNSIWANKLEKTNTINYNYKTGLWKFNDLFFANKKQELSFNGEIGKNKSKELKLTLQDVDLQQILPNIDSLEVGGFASGEIFFKEKNNLLKPNGNLTIQDLNLNGVHYGLMKTSIYPNEKKLGYDVNLNIINNNTENIAARGEIIVDANNFLTSAISLNVVLDQLKLNSLSPLGRDVLSAIRGQANGTFTVSGKLNDFSTYGDISLVNAGLKFPYLNTDYNLTDNATVKLQGKTFVFKKVRLEDDKFKTTGDLSGTINYDKYNNWFLDLKIDTNNLLVMNTEQQEDSKYFGTGFMKGFATIKGFTSNLAINVTGTTLENTKFTLPISDVSEVESNRFIYFKEVSKTENRTSEKTAVNTAEGGLTIALNLDITKDAFGEVVIDQTSGSSLQGRVDGRLLVDIDKYFNIKMYGDLVVEEGLYNFKYGGVINKPFVVKKGGTVSWSGDPYKANLNIQAVHSVKANPKVLLENLSVNRKIDVDLVTQVTGELFESNQDFKIDVPNVSSNVASELDFKLNIDENTKMRQFFSLLVSKSFFDENSGEGSTSNVLSNTTSELISSAITDIFNNDDNKLQVNFGYTAGETSDVENLTIDNQIDIGVATEINDRILINGNVGVPVGAKTQSTVVGEVKIEFLVNKNGTLRTSIFNRQNEIQYSQDEQGYTQGLGLNYQIDFNNLREMLQKLKIKSKPKKNKSLVP